ncbi:MAG TPA: lysophospholipid acyltransferase family protein [Actinotalea sp.]
MPRAQEADVAGPTGGVPRWARMVGTLLTRVVWRTEVLGADLVPRDGAVILAANHLSVIDGPVLLGAAPRGTHVIVKEEMFGGVLGVILRRARQIPMDRDAGRGGLAAALGVLRRGGVVGIFPEGNRGRGDASSGRAGVAWLAVTSGAAVVPVAVLGTRRTGESVGHVPWPRRRIVVAFGEPVVLTRAPGVSGREAVSGGAEVLLRGLADHVAEVSRRTGIALPADDPDRTATGPVRR